jgi:hypothetical protein
MENRSDIAHSAKTRNISHMQPITIAALQSRSIPLKAATSIQVDDPIQLSGLSGFDFPNHFIVEN